MPRTTFQLPTLNDMADLDNEGVDLERERVPRRLSWGAIPPDKIWGLNLTQVVIGIIMGNPQISWVIVIYGYILGYIYIYYQSTIIIMGIYGYNPGVYIYITQLIMFFIMGNGIETTNMCIYI